MHILHYFLKILIVLSAVLGTIIYRISVVSAVYSGSGGFLKKHAKIFTTITAATINLIMIMILTRVSIYHPFNQLFVCVFASVCFRLCRSGSQKALNYQHSYLHYPTTLPLLLLIHFLLVFGFGKFTRFIIKWLSD